MDSKTSTTPAPSRSSNRHKQQTAAPESRRSQNASTTDQQKSFFVFPFGPLGPLDPWTYSFFTTTIVISSCGPAPATNSATSLSIASRISIAVLPFVEALSTASANRLVPY